MWFVYALIGNLLWSVSDVTNSIIVKHENKSPFTISWVQGVIDLVILGILSLFVQIEAVFIPWYLLAGVTAYGGFIVFFMVLDRMDVSVMNAAWAFLAMAISGGSFIWFGESWTAWQTSGVVLVMLGIFYLSFYHTHVSIPRTVLWLSLLGVLYAPFFLIQKYTLLQGAPLMSVFFWPVLFQRTVSVIAPLCLSRPRNNIKQLGTSVSKLFLPLCSLAIVASLGGTYLMTKAYDLGFASLVAVAENIQPFFSMMIAGLLSVSFVKTYLPKEMLTKQSVQVKAISFVVVGVGLGLLAI